jgi:hypothetical protein
MRNEVTDHAPMPGTFRSYALIAASDIEIGPAPIPSPDTTSA